MARAAPRPWREVRPSRGPPEGPVYFDRAPGLVRLDQNTNPRAPAVVGRAGPVAARAELNRYGTARGSRLRAALARTHGVPEANVIVGNGSDEVLHTVARAYLGPRRRAALFRPGYDPYAVFALWTGASVREMPVDPFELGDRPWPTPRGFLDGVDVLYHSSPHNPTGRLSSGVELAAWASATAKRGGLVVMDEAYAEYAQGAGGRRGALWDRIEGPGRVLFTRTFSKAWGLAGLRVGWGVGPAEVIRRLEAFSVPFTLDTLAEELAVQALEDPSFVRESAEIARRERPRLGDELKGRGFQVLPSEANFLLTRPPVDGQRLWQELRERGVLLRRVPRATSAGIDLRVTVGLPEEHQRLLVALDDVLGRSEERPSRRASKDAAAPRLAAPGGRG